MTRRVLFLYLNYTPRGRERSTIQSHARMLETIDADLDVAYYNTMSGEVPPVLYRRDIDVVILHTTLLTMRWYRLFNYVKKSLDWLKSLDCIKIAMPQDEYDYSEVLDEWLFELGVTHIFSNFGAEHWPVLYPLMSAQAKFEQVFTGYIDETTAQQMAGRLKPMAERPLDIVYRARHLPYRFGSHGQLKWQIGDIVAKRALKYDLKVDISTHPQDTIYGGDWFDFLASGRAVIGVESGSSGLEPRGNVHAQIEYLLQSDPTLTFEQVSAHLPPGWDDYRFFAISPRHFESVITKTCQVLVAGHYEGVLRANEHYIPLNRDFSNLDSVLEQLRDPARLQTIADNAYRDIYLSGKYTYRAPAEKLLRAIEDSPSRRHNDVRLWSYARKYSRIESELRWRYRTFQSDLLHRLRSYRART